MEFLPEYTKWTFIIIWYRQNISLGRFDLKTQDFNYVIYMRL